MLHQKATRESLCWLWQKPSMPIRPSLTSGKPSRQTRQILNQNRPPPGGGGFGFFFFFFFLFCFWCGCFFFLFFFGGEMCPNRKFFDRGDIIQQTNKLRSLYG